MSDGRGLVQAMIGSEESKLEEEMGESELRHGPRNGETNEERTRDRMRVIGNKVR